MRPLLGRPFKSTACGALGVSLWLRDAMDRAPRMYPYSWKTNELSNATYARITLTLCK
jgi:hypothetical protein